MIIEQALTKILQDNAGLTAVISKRVFEGELPQNEQLPCIVYNRISTPRIHTHDDPGATGLAYPRFQVDAWATNYLVAKQVTDLIRSALDGYKGSVTIGSESVSIYSALVADERVNHDPPTGLKGLSSDYIVWHKE